MEPDYLLWLIKSCPSAFLVFSLPTFFLYSSSSITITMSEVKTFSFADLADHSSRDSLFLAVGGKVYDCTDFIDEVTHLSLTVVTLGGRNTVFICWSEISSSCSFFQEPNRNTWALQTEPHHHHHSLILNRQPRFKSFMATWRVFNLITLVLGPVHL